MTAPAEKPEDKPVRLYESVEWRDDDQAPHPKVEASDQIADAIIALQRPAQSYLRWPWEALDGMTGGMAPGDVWFVVAGSSIGKTTLVSSAVELWRRQHRRVMVLPLEIRARSFRTILACQALGLKPGEVMSGDIHRWPDAAFQIKRIRDELLRQGSDPEFANYVRVKGVPFINAERLEAAVEEAVDFGADVVIVDHIDHVEGEGSDLYSASVGVNKRALKMAQKHDKLLLFTSQTNQAQMRGTSDKLAHFGPPMPDHVFMGAHKRMIATGMVGIYRPVRTMRTDEGPEEYAEQIKRCRAGQDEAWKALESGVMGINSMKSRNGKPEGARCFLRVEQGRVEDLPERDQYATTRQGIRTREPQ